MPVIAMPELSAAAALDAIAPAPPLVPEPVVPPPPLPTSVVRFQINERGDKIHWYPDRKQFYAICGRHYNCRLVRSSTEN